MKKRWFALCMCIVMLAGILTSCGTNTGKIKFGAAGLGGTYRVFGDTFANLVTSKNKKYKMEVKTTAGLLNPSSIGRQTNGWFCSESSSAFGWLYPNGGCTDRLNK